MVVALTSAGVSCTARRSGFDAGDFDAGVFDAGDFDAGVFDAGGFDAGGFDAFNVLSFFMPGSVRSEFVRGSG